jgi:class 3 adenylate cyclase/pimeloyl-ACP methyl ester carboxylesterase
MDVPETRYARSGDVNVAYQVVGGGPFDLVFSMGFAQHLELGWEEPRRRWMFERLASFARLILFDKRGTGLSDPVTRAATLEERMDDIRAVLDAVESERAAVVGVGDAGPVAALFAATYPERVFALVLYSFAASWVRRPGYPWGPPEQEILAWADATERLWGTAEWVERVHPNVAPSATPEEFREFARPLRLSVSPAGAAAMQRLHAQMDVRGVLPSIRTPTLVLHAADGIDLAEARDAARRIRGARFGLIPGEDHIPFFAAAEPFADEVQAFTEGTWEARQWEQDVDVERVLATVLFTDIVGSTARAAELGDRQWRSLMERHHASVRREIARFGGVEHDSAGGGFFASFDGPARAIRCACAIREALTELDLEIRAGLHTGECELLDSKVAGIAVSIGARVAAQAGPGELLVSQTVKDLVAGSGLEFEDRGAAELKGVPGEWRLYAVAG